MVRTKLLLFLGAILALPAFAELPVMFYLDRCQFADPTNQPYIETVISIDGNTVKYKPTQKNSYQASVNVSFLLQKLQGKDSLFVTGDKFNLLSTELQDTSDMITKGLAFSHLKRIELAPGKYVLKVEVKDNYQPKSSKTGAMDVFEVKPSEADEIAFSDIQFINSIKKAENENEFTKHGYEIIPFGTDALFVEQDKMRFYVEVYHADKSFQSEYFLQAMIKCGNKTFFEHSYTNRKTPASMDVFTGQFDISKLPSQHYVLEVNAKQNGVTKRLVMRTFDVINSRVKLDLQAFTASKDEAGIFGKYSLEELRYYIESISVLATRTESSMGKSLETKEQCASFLYGFWKKREKAEEPVAYLWDSHVKKVAFVTQNYKSNLRPGYKTDRGRVFLMYGIPSNLERFPAETGALPYEIWRYDRLGAQNNVIFIFYDPDLATNEYPLLHSSKYGEVNNPRWRSIILKQNSTHIDYEGQNSDWDTKLNPND